MLEVKGLNQSYGKQQVLNNVSFTIEAGEITGLIGVNGTGKTTLMKCIMNLTPIQSGEILLDGQPVTQQTMERLIFVPDEISILKNMTVGESLDYMATYYRRYDPNRASDLLAFFNLDPDAPIHTFSKGNIAKINLLMSLAIDSDYLLLDEPFSGIDIFTREEMRNVFSSDLLQGKGVLISTHDIEEIDTFLDHVLIMEEGEIVRDFYAEEARMEGQSVIDVLREVHGK